MKHADKFKYDKVLIGKDKIKLVGNVFTVTIDNFDRFRKINVLDRYFENTMNEIKKAIVLNQMKKIKNIAVQNIKLEHKKIIAGFMTTAMLLSGGHVITENIINNDSDEIVTEVEDTLVNINDIAKANDNNIEENKRISIFEEELKNEKKKQKDKDKNNINVIENNIKIDVENISNGVKSRNVIDNYKDTIEIYAQKWGLSPNFITSIITQESGGNEANLMQIVFNSWRDQVVTAYNFNDNTYQSIVLTDNPGKYNNNIMCISREDLNNPKTNISVGTIILTHSLRAFNYNIPLAMTAYNFGIGNVNKVLDVTAYHTGISKQQLINNPSNIDFLKYRNVITVGDPKYFEHVIQYINNYEEGVSAFNKENNTLYKLNIDYEEEKSNTI